MFPMTVDDMALISGIKTHCADKFIFTVQCDEVTLAWLAGILEGEASFMLCGKTLMIGIQMTDKDVIEKVSAILGIAVRAPWKPRRKETYKLVYSCSISSFRAAVWMATVFPYMGERRREKIRTILPAWKSVARPKSLKGHPLPATCHPERPRCAFGLCRPCHMKQYRKRRALSSPR